MSDSGMSTLPDALHGRPVSWSLHIRQDNQRFDMCESLDSGGHEPGNAQQWGDEHLDCDTQQIQMVAGGFLEHTRGLHVTKQDCLHSEIYIYKYIHLVWCSEDYIKWVLMLKIPLTDYL